MAHDPRFGPPRRTLLGAAGHLLPTATLAASQKAPIRLSLNESPYGPSLLVSKAIQRAASKLDRYVTDDEVAAFARQIAHFESVAPEQVILGEVLTPLGQHLASSKSGGGIIFSSPGYTELVDAAQPLGGKAVPVPLNSRLENDIPAINQAIDDRTLAVSLVNPHNPSGTVNDLKTLDAFISAAAARTLVIVDEAYMEYDDLPRRSAIRLMRRGLNVVVFRTFAKIHGLAGLAFDYAVMPLALAGAMRTSGTGNPHTLNRLSLAAASAALKDQAHVAHVRRKVTAERERVTRVLDHLGLEHSDSRASFVFFRSPKPAEDIRSAFTAQGIEIGRAFAPLDEWIRITIGLPAENDAVIAALSALYG